MLDDDVDQFRFEVGGLGVERPADLYTIVPGARGYITPHFCPRRTTSESLVFASMVLGTSGSRNPPPADHYICTWFSSAFSPRLALIELILIVMFCNQPSPFYGRHDPCFFLRPAVISFASCRQSSLGIPTPPTVPTPPARSLEEVLSRRVEHDPLEVSHRVSNSISRTWWPRFFRGSAALGLGSDPTRSRITSNSR